MAQGAAAARRPVIIRRVTLAAALALTAALTGCGKDAPDPTPSSNASTPSATAMSSSPAPSPTPTPPPKPATWGDVDPTAAVDAAIYFKSLYNYALETGDLTEWRALSDPGCGFCSGVADDISKVYSAGGHYDGGEVDLSASTLVSASAGVYEVQHTYSSTKSVVVSADGTTHDSADAEDGYVVFQVIASQPGWVLLGATARDTPLPAIPAPSP